MSSVYPWSYYITSGSIAPTFLCGIALKLSKATEYSRAIFLTASGTGAMEAAVINCLNHKDHVLTIDGGSFGHRFAQICERHRLPQSVLKFQFGKTLTYEMLEAVYKPGMTALLVNLQCFQFLNKLGTAYASDMTMTGCIFRRAEAQRANMNSVCVV